MKKRMDFWGELIGDFGYDDIGLPSSVVSVYNLMNPTLVSQPLYHAAYSLGGSLGAAMVGPIREAIGRERQCRYQGSL